MSWKSSLGAALSGWTEGNQSRLELKQKQDEALAKAALEEITRNMDERKFQLQLDEFDLKKQVDLARIAAMGKKSGGGGRSPAKPRTNFNDKPLPAGTEIDKDTIASSIMAAWEEEAKRVGRELNKGEKKKVAAMIAKPYGLTLSDLGLK